VRRARAHRRASVTLKKKRGGEVEPGPPMETGRKAEKISQNHKKKMSGLTGSMLEKGKRVARHTSRREDGCRIKAKGETPVREPSGRRCQRIRRVFPQKPNPDLGGGGEMSRSQENVAWDLNARINSKQTKRKKKKQVVPLFSESQADQHQGGHSILKFGFKQEGASWQNKAAGHGTNRLRGDRRFSNGDKDEARDKKRESPVCEPV